MIRTMFAAALALAAAAAAAQTPAATTGTPPKCSATVRDSCDQGADNPRAMTAEQAMASGGVGDRRGDDAAPAAGRPMARKAMHHKLTRTTTAATTTTSQ